MSIARIAVLTVLAMIAFAGNSLLCRAALKAPAIDAASFTTIRMVSGALVLWLIVQLTRRSHSGDGNWWSALALFGYAAAFSFAYGSLPAASGALVLFGAVQLTMIGHGLWSGERFRGVQVIGLLMAIAGLVSLLLPGLSAPPLVGALLMVCAGLSWGVYSLRAKGQGDPTRVTAGNFLRTIPMALAVSLLMHDQVSISTAGFWWAVSSGALASALGYAIWYTALPALKATNAAVVQFSVPVIASLGAVVFLDEQLSSRLLLASLVILGGIGLVIAGGRRA
jgi:drug/metabolite transporter (DMT)-like permease